MAVEQVAKAHYRAQQTLGRQTAAQAQVLWREVHPASVLESWLSQLAQMIRILTAGQTAAAAMAQPYVDALAAEQGLPSPPAIVNPVAFAGVAADGRTLASLLIQPALRTLGLLTRGADDRTALLGGLASLTRIVDTEIADASRAADQVGMVAQRRWVTYVRHVTLPACSRCIILAGREYSWSTGFLRHPRCDCTMVPRRAGDEPPPSPQDLFDELTPEEQNKTFTAAGAEAIRLGADLGQVVNARRGMQTVGGRLVTTEGTTVRGHAGRKLGNFKRQPGERYRRSQVPRPMPEQILQDARDRDEAIRLLQRFGYLTPASGRARPAPLTTSRRPAAQPRRTAVPEGARPYHRNLDDLRDLADAVEDQHVTNTRRLGGSSAQTELLTLADGTKVIRKTAKPGTGDLQDAAAEHATSLVARKLGLPAPRVYRNDSDSVYMEYVADGVTPDEAAGGGDLPERFADAPASRDGMVLGLLDLLVNNVDRNGGNWMLDGQGRLVPIDHGLSYGEFITEGMPPTLEWVHSRFVDHYKDDAGQPRDNPLTREDVAEVRRRLQELRPDFAHIGHPEWLDYSLRMLDVLAEHATGTRNLIAGIQ